MKKKPLVILVLTLIGLLAVVGYTLAGQAVSVLVNGSPLQSDVPPAIQDGRIMAPIRPVAEALGADVQWDGATNTARITLGEPTTPPESTGTETRLIALEKKIDGIIDTLKFVPTANSASTKTFVNTNRTAVNDLHLELVQACFVDDSGPFGDYNGGGTTTIDFSNPENDIQQGGSAKIKLSSTSSRITIKQWWWTKDGVRVGPVNTQ